MQIKALKQTFSVCQLADFSQVDWTSPFVFLAKTDQENSLVCPSREIPINANKVDSGWRAFRIEGVLDFSLIGILAEISGLLANHHISIFALSTYNTDYVLTKANQFDRAIDLLAAESYEILV